MIYRIEIKRSARKMLLALPRQIRERIGSAIDALAHDPYPSGTCKLAGSDSLYRKRVGDYRIIYEVHGHRLVVMIIKIGHRRNVYR
jgi:mRNA interferase RelE/StbE